MPYKYEPRPLTLQEVLKIEEKLLKNGKVEFRRGIDRTKRLATLDQGVWVDGVWMNIDTFTHLYLRELAEYWVPCYPVADTMK